MSVQERLNKLWPLLRLYEQEPYNERILFQILELCYVEELPLLPFKRSIFLARWTPIYYPVLWDNLPQEAIEWCSRFLESVLPWGKPSSIKVSQNGGRWSLTGGVSWVSAYFFNGQPATFTLTHGNPKGTLTTTSRAPENLNHLTWPDDFNLEISNKFGFSHPFASLQNLTFYLDDLNVLLERVTAIVKTYNTFADNFAGEYGLAHLEDAPYVNAVRALTPDHERWNSQYLAECAPDIMRQLSRLHSRAFFGYDLPDEECPFVQSWAWRYPVGGVKEL